MNFNDRPIKDIAFGLGFDDPYYFSKRFRKNIGMSPKKYRAFSMNEQQEWLRIESWELKIENSGGQNWIWFDL